MYTTNNASLLMGLWNIVESYGIDPVPLFREMNLNPELIKQPGGRYRLDSIDNLWRKASEIIDDPCFGLKAAEYWHLCLRATLCGQPSRELTAIIVFFPMNDSLN